MSHIVRRILYLAMGILAGLAAWPFMEGLLAVQHRMSSYLLFSLASGAAFGLVMGAFFGAIDGMVAGVRRRVFMGALLGAAIGAAGGALGFVLAQWTLLVLADFGNLGVGGARAFGWSILGIAIGASEGVRRRSVRRLAVGVFGGFLGGLLGGLAIYYAPLLLPSNWARPVGLMLFGILVSVFYGVFERTQITGVLRILNGPRKGSEFVLNQRRLIIGEWVGSDVQLGGYRRVADRHAEIRERNGELVLYPLGENGTVRRNDEDVSENGSGFLKFGDVIQCGSAKMLLRPLLALVALLFVLPVGGAAAQSVRPTQIDTSRLLSRQQVVLWVSVTGGTGETVTGLTPADLRVTETDDAGREFEAPVLAVEERAALDEGITFVLLVDNSGSMYDRIDGTPTDEPSETRMAAAVGAIEQFLAGNDNRRNRFALATFNTNYRLLTQPTASTGEIELLLNEIERPQPDEAYTELFRGINSLVADLEGTEGRLAILILSDGENYPYAEHSGDPHPLWGEEILPVEEVLTTIERSGIGVFGIDFADEGEPLLDRIVATGGGLTFRADDQGELASVYDEIRDQILTEYRVTYRAGISPSEYRTVRIAVTTPAGPAEAERRYFSGTIFGLPREDLGPIFLLPVAVAILLAALLTLLRVRARRGGANLEILTESGVGTKVLDLSGEKTVIGAAADADLTIAGSPDMQDRHATIVKDEQTGRYTLTSTVPVTVNNRQYTRRALQPGDVLELPGATIVFDKPED